jgi:hypothetical protein
MRKHIAVVVSSFLLACGPSGAGPDGGPGDNGNTPDGAPGAQADAWETPNWPDAAPGDQCDKMDILFVIDNSGSMGQEQANLAANFPGFIQVLEDYGDLDYRVAVTTTGVDYSWNMSTPLGNIPSSQDDGDNGAMLQRCDMNRRWVQADDPDPSATFSCAAQVGDSGPSREMPLRSMKLAFSDRMADNTNAGFRRDDALLAIVVLTDEDDCSYDQSVDLGFGQSLCDDGMTSVSSYVSFLDQYTGDRGRWATAVIAGPDDCSSDFGNADKADRLLDFVSQTGTNAVFSSICDGDLTIGLAAALETFDLACQQFPPVD